jgi:hypothetical protein
MSAAARRELAEALRVTPRTLRNWRRDAERAPGVKRRPGRPRRSRAEYAVAKERVRSVLEHIGISAGENTVCRELDGEVAVRLVRESLADLKAEHRARERHKREEARTSVHVSARCAIWSVDGTHLGRDEAGTAQVGEIVRDVASTTTLGVSVGPPPTSAEVVALLKHVVAEVGEVPLVLSIDNGPENQGELDAWCTKMDVVRLRNLPHTPQHNPWVEHGNGEIKAETGLGKGMRIGDVHCVVLEVARALDCIDGARPRETRGWRTARETYAALPSAEALIDRQQFAAEVRCAIEHAVQDCRTARGQRLAEREAILTSMECSGLIKRTRGRASRWTRKAEDVL